MNATYFLAPSWDIHPDELCLGSVIANVKTPNRPLSAATLPIAIDPPLLQPQEETQLSGIARKSKEWTTGLFATFIQVITLGGELSISSTSSIEIEYLCNSVTTQRFTPSPSYITKAAEDPGVRDFLKMGGIGAKVFMITGIKVAHQATITTIEESGKETNAQLGLEIPPLPVSLGPKGSYKPSHYRKTTRTIEGPFVFAFQVEKMRISRKGKVSHKEHVDGAMLAHGKREEQDYVLEPAGQSLGEDEVEDFDVDFRPGIEDETGQACEIIVP